MVLMWYGVWKFNKCYKYYIHCFQLSIVCTSIKISQLIAVLRWISEYFSFNTIILLIIFAGYIQYGESGAFSRLAKVWKISLLECIIVFSNMCNNAAIWWNHILFRVTVSAARNKWSKLNYASPKNKMKY